MLDHMENVAEVFLALKNFKEIGKKSEESDESKWLICVITRFAYLDLKGFHKTFVYSKWDKNNSLLTDLYHLFQAFCHGSTHPFLSIYVEYLGHNIYRRFLRRK